MNKPKSSLALNILDTNPNDIYKSSTSFHSSKKQIKHNSTLPNLRSNIFNESFYESFVEKYNEKINLWQNCFIYVKKNYLYLYDKRPKTLEKPNEYLYLNNKISMTFHRRLFKLRALKNYVVNIKINNESLSKSYIEDNKHNLYLSFKSQHNYNNFRKVVENVLNCKQYTNSVSPNQLENSIKNEKNEKGKKKKTYRHIKIKSESHIQLCNNLLNNNINNKEIINSNENKNKNCYKSNVKNHNMNNNSVNRNNTSLNSIHNVFTFSKVDNSINNANEAKINNSNSSKRSNSCNTNNKRNLYNNFVIEGEKGDIYNSINNINNVSNSKRTINYFNTNINENNAKLKYSCDYSSINNNIFNVDFLPSIKIDTSYYEKPNTSLVYSIKRKKEKIKEDENRLNMKKQRRNSCYQFKLDKEKYNNIFLKPNEKKGSLNKIKTIKIKLKNYHSFCNIEPSQSILSNMNNSDYSRDEKNISLIMNNTNNQSMMNYSFNDIEEKNSENKNSKSKTKSKEKENDKTKNNTISNTDISLMSLKSFKSDTKEKQDKDNTIKTNNFEGMNIYSYIDNKSNNDCTMNNSDKNENIQEIRSQISQVIKQNEEMISNIQDESDKNNNEEDTDVIFTSRLIDEIHHDKIITEPSSKDKEESINEKKYVNNKSNNEDENNDINLSTKIEINSNEVYPSHLRFSSDLNDLIQSLEHNNKTSVVHNSILDINNNMNNISIPFNTFFKSRLNLDFLDFNFDSIINDKNMMNKLIAKIDNNEIYILDSSICNLLLSKIKERIKCLNTVMDIKERISKKEILGKIYNLTQSKSAKIFFICEMISIISKKELNKIIINSIEVYNKKKEINIDEKNVNYDEYIISIFNKYLSKNEQNKESAILYNEIIPTKLKEYFNIKDSEGSLINIIKNDIHVNTLFNSMQYHNKIYFCDKCDSISDFNTLNNLNSNSKYIISPYILEKWKLKALKKTDNNKDIFEEYKIYEKSEEMNKFKLIKNIIRNINNNEINIALKNCEFFLMKYNIPVLIFHPLIYLFMSYIYIKISNLEESEKYYNKSYQYLIKMFPFKNNFLFFEFEYNHLLILLNNEENIVRKNIENISDLIKKCNSEWKKYNNNADNIELNLDEIMFKIYFGINDNEKNNDKFFNNFYYNDIKPLMNEFDNGKLNKRKNLSNVYFKVFIEFFKKCPGCDIKIFNDLIKYFDTL